MFENFFTTKQKEITSNALHGEHLREGIRPILASINDYDRMDDETRRTISEIEKDGDFVDFAANQNNMLNAGVQTYVVSDCNENNKWSEGYWNCTGVIAIGVDKETGKEISILTHQNPEKFLNKDKNEKDFDNDLSKRIANLLERSEKDTVDVVVFGGHDDSRSEYLKSIKKISEICTRVLGYEPVVLTGPNINSVYETEVYLDTQKRRLYLVRPPQYDNMANQSYNPSDIKKETKKWRR